MYAASLFTVLKTVVEKYEMYQRCGVVELVMSF